MDMSSARRTIGLVICSCLVMANCGEGDQSADDTTSPAESIATASTTSTTEPTTTTDAPTTTTSTTPTTTEFVLSDEDYEQHLAAGLLTADDLPDYMNTVYENGAYENPATGVFGDLAITPCGDDVIEPVAIDARNSYFTFDESIQLDPQPVILAAVPIVRQPLDADGPSLVDLFQEALTPCVYEEIVDPTNDSPMMVGPVFEVEERGGVRAVGRQAVSTDDGLGVLNFVFETESIDGHLLLVTYGTGGSEAERALALPVVEAFQDRLATCTADATLCSAPVL